MEDLANSNNCFKINTNIIVKLSLIHEPVQEYFDTKVCGKFGHNPTTISLSGHENICMDNSLSHCKQV